MKKISHLKRLVFDGFLAQDELKKLENTGIGLHVDVSPLARIEENDFNPVLVHDAEKMASVYVAFFCLENSARELISTRLAERQGLGWWDLCVPERVKKAASGLKEKEAKNKYHTQRSSSSSLIYYTMFGNLAQIIIGNWEDFSDLFPDQAWVNSRFNDLELSRNIIMHTNVLPELEQERIESITRDWVRQVG